MPDILKPEKVNSTIQMKKRALAFIFYTIFWLVFFAFARLFFIAVQYKEAIQHDAATLAETFLHGIKLDISATGYFLILPVLLSIPGIWFNRNWFRYFVRYYTFILIFFSSVIMVSDASLYTYWGFRMDYTPFLYLKTPREAMASAGFIQAVIVILEIIIITSLFIYLYRKLIDKFFSDFVRVRKWLPAMFLVLILLASLLIPIRGGFGIAPINSGTVYFNEKMFPNHVAVNAIWNVGKSLSSRKPLTNPYEFGDSATAKTMVEALNIKNDSPRKVLNNERPNIIIIILESFGNSLIGPLGGDESVTPNINRYVEEGILFTNFYASGNRTDKALPAILSGYPAQPVVSIIKEPKKTQSLPGIVKMLIDRGYYSSFWYGGEINFANFNSFVISSGFRNIITMDNFNPSDYNSKWGVHDHILFKALEDSMKTVVEPFINVILTLSSHEPFEVPMEPVFEGKDDLTKFKNSVYYTDSVVGSFLDRAKNTSWWKNSLVILVSDHCRRNSVEEPVFSEEIFRIPMLWLGGALKEKGFRVDKYGSQADLPLTILNQLDIESSFPFGKDLLAKGSGSYAFYVFNEGFAFLTDSSKYIYDHKFGDAVIRDGKNPEVAEKNGKAYLQVVFDDYLNR
jgi:phosphoglycerol transferase MdoB-like AlkP superfamily enzyme